MAGGAVPVGLIAGLIALVVGPVAAVVVFVVVTAAVAGWLWQGGERRVRATIGGRPADAATDARLLNLVDGLCTTAGLRPPRVIVTPDQAPNLLVAGRSPARAVLAVTSGLVGSLTRTELEGVLADGLVQIRSGDIVPATVAVGTFGLGARWARGDGDRDGEVDRAGASLTRYPPALMSAFEAMDRQGTVVDGVPACMAHLWLADPLPPTRGPERSDRPALAARVAALREL